MSKPIDQELLPCPCCSGADLQNEPTYIMCNGCGLMIDRCDAPGNDFRAAWSNRAAVQPAGMAVAILVDREWLCELQKYVSSFEKQDELRAILAAPYPVNGDLPGRDQLWGWFGMSYASFLSLPRVLMHEMPDQWQADMARLLAEWDAAWETDDLPSPCVSAKQGNKFTRWPAWLLDYRHPDRASIEACRARNGGEA